MAQKSNDPQSLSLATRTLFFLVLLSMIGLGSLALIFSFQEKVNLASKQIREQLLPTSSLVEKVSAEMAQQLRELSSFAKENPQKPAAVGLARLSPAARSLLSFHKAKLLPRSLDPLVEPWADSVQSYMQAHESGTATARKLQQNLSTAYQRTELLKRAVDREFSIQLLTLAAQSQRFLEFWTGAFILNLVLMLTFLYLLHRWTSPLYALSRWIEQSPAPMLPRPLQSSGLMAPPFEIQKLHSAMRDYVLQLREQANVLEDKRKNTEETEKAMGSLFSVLRHVMEHNEELLRQLLLKERLASMGEMAAELAHEIRNPLNSMNLKLELLKDDLNPEQQNVLDRVLAEIDRLDALTESHLRNTKATLQATLENTELVKLLQSAVDDMRADFSTRNIHIESHFPQSSPLSPLPESVLKAVMINLLKNSVESFAQEKQDGRKISVHLTLSSQEGDWKLLVLDNGCGFPEDLRNKPFTSFQTTKSQGSGLGLATSYKMLKAWGLDMELLFPPPLGFSTCLQISFHKEVREKQGPNPAINLGNSL